MRKPADWIADEDLGLGLCYQGVRALALLELERQEVEESGNGHSKRLDGSMSAGFRPNWAVTLAPYPVPNMAGPIPVVLALPVCFGCMTSGPGACGGLKSTKASTLIIGQGKVPGT